MQTVSRQPRKWTLAEDQKLREEVEIQLVGGGDIKDWCRIAARLPGRTNKDCRKRWHNSVAGGLKKGQWSKSEDELLARGVQQHGQRWTLVASCVESRSADQCAKRWQQSLDPDLDRSEWRDEEDHILIEATQHLGRHWKDIQREHFPGRSKNCIKNRYTVLVRRYQNQGITLPSRASTPSEPDTPSALSQYSPEGDYTSYDPSLYGALMPPQSQVTSASRHRSWSNLESDSVSAWSSPQDYGLPMTLPTTDMTNTMPDYTFAPPRTLGSNVSSAAAAAHWNWTSTSMNVSAPMQAQSPISYTAAVPTHYDDYGMPRPVMTTGRSYSRSPARATYSAMPNAAPTSVPRARAWSDNQHYDSLQPTTYPDPRLQQNPLYRF
ncbi:hypothetical protein CC86DRAFT_109350 [Ophiobolus disseminans]|uniref:Uncharacterized protein n=1 Tax=Ophiobolus disseminans TaxID=1469910 RepID=A0A6A6ZLL4_9PLEO|nr:hypothetical protein CC86DRAFT_109350 [Ophiobolus disseminans]